MPIPNPFGLNAFNMVSLTNSINKLPYKPGRIGELGLFEEQGVTTTTVVIEEKDGILSLLPTKQRGAPATLGRGEKRKVRSFAIPHIPYEDSIRPEDVQNVREFGSEDQLQAVARVVNDRLTKMRQDHEVTLEHLRVGAIHGNIVDADGSTVLYNLFDEFGVTERSVSFQLSTTNTDVRNKCVEVMEAIEEALGAATYTGVRAFCGKDFFKALISHASVKDAYKRQQSEQLRSDLRKGFEFCDITFEQYRGKIGSVSFVADDACRFVPMGVPGLFVTYYAPGDFMETANTIGIPIYAKQEPLPFNRGVMLHTQSNPLPLCLRPGVLIKGIQNN